MLEYPKSKIEIMVLNTSDLLIHVSGYWKNRAGCIVIDNANAKRMQKIS